MRTTLAIYGRKGTYTDLIARRIFPDTSDEAIIYGKTSKIIAAVSGATADVGVVPYFNTHAGNVDIPLNMGELVMANVFVIGIPSLKIKLHLVSQEHALEDIRTVYSMKVVIPQCRDFLDRHLSGAKIVSEIVSGGTRETVAATVAAVEQASKERGTAGIGSEKGANLFRVPILRRDIHNRQNQTRFLVLSHSSACDLLHDRRLLAIRMPDGPRTEAVLSKILGGHRISVVPWANHDGSCWYVVEIDYGYIKGNWNKILVQLKTSLDDPRIEGRILGSFRLTDQGPFDE